MAPPSQHNTPLSVPAVGSELSRQRAERVGIRGSRYTRSTAAEKLAARIIKLPNGCLEAQGWATHSGHVQISRRAEGLPIIRAHVLAWTLANGPVPEGMHVLHNCPTGDNPRCCNIAHLWLGTQRDNIHDAIHKGRFNAFGRQRLNAEQVQQIRALIARGLKHKDIAKQFGIARSTVTGLAHGTSWQHLPVRLPVFERVPHVNLEIRGEVGP